MTHDGHRIFEVGAITDCCQRYGTQKGKHLPALLIQAALRFALTLAHLARCAVAIFLRAATDIVRVLPLFPRPAYPEVPLPTIVSIATIALSNFVTCSCACVRSSRSCCSASVNLSMFAPFSKNRQHWHCRGSHSCWPASDGFRQRLSVAFSGLKPQNHSSLSVALEEPQ